MVARLKEAIRLDPALADTNLPAYTRQEIAEAMDHVRRATDLFCAVTLALLVAVGQEPSLWKLASLAVDISICFPYWMYVSF
jgi:hypothetical protein